MDTRARSRQRAWLGQLQRPQHARSRRRQGLLRGRFRLGRARALRRGRDVDPGGLRRVPRDLHPRVARAVEESGAPEGFADVVASMSELGDDQPDTQPNWSVTFAVDDADAAARKAEELGGAVIVPPMDAPWVRMTVLADPQGATLHRQQVRAREQGPCVGRLTPTRPRPPRAGPSGRRPPRRAPRGRCSPRPAAGCRKPARPR